MAAEGDVEIDDYIRLGYSGPRGAGGNGWVFLRDERRNRLAEIWIDRDSGRITQATLVSHGQAAGGLPAGWFESPAEDGVPLLTLRPPFEDGAAVAQRDFACELSFHAGDGRALVVFGSAPDKMLRSGRGRFFFARGALVGFGAEGLSAAEEIAAARA